MEGSTVSFLDGLKSGWGTRFNGALTRTGFDAVSDFADATDELLREYLQPELRRDGARPLEIHRIIKAIAAFGADPSQPMTVPPSGPNTGPERRLVKLGCGCQVYVSCGQPGHDTAWRSCAMCNESASDGAVFVESVANGVPVCLRCVELPTLSRPVVPPGALPPGPLPPGALPPGAPQPPGITLPPSNPHQPIHQGPVRFTSLPAGSLGGGAAGPSPMSGVSSTYSASNGMPHGEGQYLSEEYQHS